MSNRHVHEAKAGRWGKPFFPQNIDRLQTFYATWIAQTFDSDIDGILKAAKASSNTHITFRSTLGVRTEDGYAWLRGVVYLVHRGSGYAGQVLLMFPHATDEARNDGTMTDRSIAVYRQGSVGEEEMEAVVDRFREGLRSILCLQDP
jgi:hypothetical protein